VLVVDEAGMVGTRKLVELAQRCERAGAKLVLVGDERQLAAIDAGGGFRACGCA
jgi:ATP-dependent exoDNAse (exonuclease V) alpha subunit